MYPYWIKRSTYSGSDVSLSWGDWLMLIGICLGVIAVTVGIIEAGCWLLYGHSMICPPKL